MKGYIKRIIISIYISRVSRHFAPIFYFNCEHLLNLYWFVKQKQKRLANLKKNSCIFKILCRSRCCWRQIFQRPDRFSRFDVIWVKTNNQSVQLYLYNKKYNYIYVAYSRPNDCTDWADIFCEHSWVAGGCYRLKNDFF